MLVVGDNNIPGLSQAVSALDWSAELRVLPSGAIDAAAVRGAELLFVRSTVRCDAALLAGSKVRFVATATIGTDHLDLAWLASQGIAVASAPGCNADSVVQWLAAALFHLMERGLWQEAGGAPLRGVTAGVVGVGNVGSRVLRLLSALGAKVLGCDPPRQRAGDKTLRFDAVDDLCRRCDLLTLHVPLLREGPDCTVHLIDERRLRLLPRGAVLINASRGEVLDAGAVLAGRGDLGGLLLDVFPGEPRPAPELVAAATIATPHIAGHSLEGKVRGTQMVYQAACQYIGMQATWAPDQGLLPRHPLDGLLVETAGRSDRAVLGDLVRRSYDICADDAALRRIVGLPPGERGPAFRRYRETYPVRRELTGARLDLRPPREGLLRMLQALGAR